MVKKLNKINIGAGPTWYEEGWDVLDNAPGIIIRLGNLREKLGKIVYLMILMILLLQVIC